MTDRNNQTDIQTAHGREDCGDDLAKFSQTAITLPPIHSDALGRSRAMQKAASFAAAGVAQESKPPVGTTAGGVKHDQDKPRMDLLDSYAIEQLALVLGFGAKKYAAHNWRHGIAYSRLVAAALRHIHAFNGGEDLDPESGLPHAAHAMCCLMFLLGMTHDKPNMDDRYKQ